MTEEALEARRAYQREWAKAHPEAVRAYKERYWEKKAQQAKADEAEADDQDTQETDQDDGQDDQLREVDDDGRV